MPETLNDWWLFIKSNDPLIKSRYFLRNYRGMGKFTTREVLDFLATKVDLTCHRRYCEDKCNVSGCYSIRGETQNLIFRVDPTTPGINGPLSYPSVVICW